MSDVASDDAPEPVEVPSDALAPATLRALIEEFVTRDGTDYGRIERTLDEKVRAVLAQLASGEARIFFDPDSETTSIRLTRDLSPPRS